MKLPVRISDNDTLNLKNMKISESTLAVYEGNEYPNVEAGKLWILMKKKSFMMLMQLNHQTNSLLNRSAVTMEEVEIAAAEVLAKVISWARIAMGLPMIVLYGAGNRIIATFSSNEKMNNSPVKQEERLVAITADDVLLDGNTVVRDRISCCRITRNRTAHIALGYNRL
jgi:hypothetical protein